MTQRILVLSANFGSGHLQAARAIAESCKTALPNCEAVAVNVAHPLSDALSKTYLQLLAHAPNLYRQLYRRSAGKPTRTLIAATFLPAVRQAIAAVQPTAVVATHPFPGAAAALLRRQGRLRATVLMAVTDFVPHPLWVQSGADGYFVAAESGVQRLTALGVGRNRVVISGIPIGPGFHRPDAASGAGTYGVRNVLIMGGGLGLGPIVEAVRSLVELDRRGLRIAVVCGRNQNLRRDLLDLFGADPRLDVIGQTNLVPQLMARADLLVTKPGGLTCSEALAAGLPMLLLQPLPGQEEENAAYLADTGAATTVAAEAVGEVASALLFDRPDALSQMQRAACLAARPAAARLIAEATLALGRVHGPVEAAQFGLPPQLLPEWQ